MLRVNGKIYDWGSVDLKLSGVIAEPQEISYDDEFEKELAYGLGGMPRGYGTGNYKASGKLVMLKNDYEALIDYCKQQGISLYKLEFPSIVVSYANEGGRTVSDVLNNVSFTKFSHKAAQGDKNMKIDIDLFIAGTIVRDGLEPV